QAMSRSRDVATSDLYAQGFDPVLGEHDLGEPVGRPGNLAELAGEAYTRGQAAPDVRAEHEKVAKAELLVLQFPLWWYGPPAILKGWLDRVLTYGSACHVGTATAGSPGAGRSWWSPPGTTSARSARAGSAATWTRCCSPDSWRPLVRRHRCAGPARDTRRRRPRRRGRRARDPAPG